MLISCAGNDWRCQPALLPNEDARPFNSSTVDPMASLSLSTYSVAPHSEIPSTMIYTSAAHGQQTLHHNSVLHQSGKGQKYFKKHDVFYCSVYNFS